MLEAPMEEQGFSRWARSQILRLNSTVARRSELKFSEYPFALHPLSHSRSTEDERRRAARAALHKTDQKGVHTKGLVKLPPTEDALLSTQCMSTLFNDFRSFGYGADMIERLNSEYTHRHPRRGQGRNSANAEREHLLGQISAIHCENGGRYPLAPRCLYNDGGTER
eukprot:4195509-Pyramimonas_sp.AAC.1